jgi:hypothetical protein
MIEITLGGAPTLSLDSSVLELEVGSRFRSEAHVSAADPVISANAEVEWSSSDESVAVVGADGEISVTGEGSATITASLGGASASVTVNGTAGEVEPAGAASPAGDGGDPGPAQAEESPSADGPAAPSEEAAPVTLGREVSVLNRAETLSESELGGVQNWRDSEMAASAVELPVISEDSPAVALAALAALALFALGGLLRLARYNKEIA